MDAPRGNQNNIVSVYLIPDYWRKWNYVFVAQ